MTAPRIDLVVFQDSYLGKPHYDLFDVCFSTIAKYLGVNYSLQVKAESDLERNPQDHNILPQEGIIYVHGDHNRHKNLDKVMRIAPQRLDLRFIVKIDSYVTEDQFSSPQMYDTYRELLGFSEVLTSPILVRDTKVIKHDGDISLVLDSPCSEEPTPFQQYLTMLLQIRRGHQ
ncbi:MAG: hypothetical protein WCV90_08010 [Candidatus Woesearchaeota archaeon]